MCQRCNRVKLPCAFWTSCCPRRLNDDDASSPCVSSQSVDGSSPPLPPQLAGRTWNFWESYGNLQDVWESQCWKVCQTKQWKKKNPTWNAHHNRGRTVIYSRLICYDMKWRNWKIKSQPINTQGYSCLGFTWSLRASLDRFSTSFS